MTRPQTYANHVRIVPLYIAALAILGIDAAWSLYGVATAPSVASVRAAVVSVALVILAVYARGFALRAQDRIIRLEMRLRLHRLLPADLQSRVDGFTHDQLIALRFAADGELPALAERVLRDDIRDRRTIKQMVVEWQADDMRV